jgi:two-component system LytT family sensor kinase
VRWDVPDELLATAVPRLTVQPLVDNAVRHGLARRARAGHLTIAARRDGPDRIAIAVTDDGAGLTPGAAERGLATVRARLARLYGAAGELRLGPATGGGARAELVVPA